MTDVAHVLPGARRRVLVVDDYRDSTDSLVLMLEALGAEALGVYDGESALEAIDSFHPDIVLLDIGLPGMSGHELAVAIRQRPDQAATMLVAVSGWDTEQSRRESAEAGINLHLVKPVEFTALQALIAPPQPTPLAC